MPTRQSEAEWKGNLREGQGTVKIGKGAWEGKYSFPSRFEDGTGTNPEELVAAGHAACYSMALSAGLDKAGHKPTRVHTVAEVTLDKVGEGFGITTVVLTTEAEVPGLDEAAFQEQAEAAKKGCPISKLFAGAEIRLNARLLQTAQ